MIPTTPARVTIENVASATTIQVRSDVVRLTGSTQIETILCNLFLGTGGITIQVVAVDGAITLGTSGNILVGQVLAQNRLYTLTYSAVVNKWYIHAVA